jgi:hypothetical protein
VKDFQAFREKRYAPTVWWRPAADAAYGRATTYCLDPSLWQGAAPLLRRMIDTYATQIGTATRAGPPPDRTHAGWSDRWGYLIAFVHPNEIFYLDPELPP